MVPLGDLMLSRGGSLTPADYPEETFELYSIPAHDRGGPELTLGSEIGSAKQIVHPQDVMISKIIPHIRRARVVNRNRGYRQIASGEWIVFRGSALNPEYLRRFLTSDVFHAQFMNTVAGVGGSLMRARPEQVKKIRVPVPSIDEQRRIAEILDAADAIRTKRRQVLAHLGALNQSIFDDMFSSVLWDSTLGEMAKVQTGPFGSLLHKSDYVQGGVPLLNPMHIQNGSLIPDPEYSVSELKASSLQAFRLQRGDVVLARRGEMGRAGVASDAHKGMLCGTGSLILRPRQGVDSRYLHAVVTSPRMKGHLNRESLGATLPNLNSKIVMGSPAPRVPLQTGRDFAAKIGAIHALSTTVARALDADNELFASLQSRAFLGAL